LFEERLWVEISDGSTFSCRIGGSSSLRGNTNHHKALNGEAIATYLDLVVHQSDRHVRPGSQTLITLRETFIEALYQ
jgi:hypothetical protein